jgi:hypothetical protein
MPVGKMYFVGKVDYLPQEIGACTETFDDTGHFLASGTSAPIVVSGCNFTSGFVVLGDTNLRIWLNEDVELAFR